MNQAITFPLLPRHDDEPGALPCRILLRNGRHGDEFLLGTALTGQGAGRDTDVSPEVTGEPETPIGLGKTKRSPGGG
jgi:hypothetical protein